MSFSVQISAESKGDALSQLECQENLPQSVRAFIALAIDGFSEPGGNYRQRRVDESPEERANAGKPIKPVAITISASGHLDQAGGSSTCSINVSQG